jgi:hypothetical protein
MSAVGSLLVLESSTRIEFGLRMDVHWLAYGEAVVAVGVAILVR